MQQAVNETGSCLGCPVRRGSQPKLSKLTHVVVTTDLPSRLELQLLWSRCGTTHSPRCYSSPLWTVGPVANFRECHESLRWGHAGPLSESSLAFSALGQKRAYSASGAASCGCWPATVYVGSSDELVKRAGCGGSCQYTPRGRCPMLGQLSWFRPAFFFFVSAGGVRQAARPTSTRRFRFCRL